MRGAQRKRLRKLRIKTFGNKLTYNTSGKIARKRPLYESSKHATPGNAMWFLPSLCLDTKNIRAESSLRGKAEYELLISYIKAKWYFHAPEVTNGKRFGLSTLFVSINLFSRCEHVNPGAAHCQSVTHNRGQKAKGRIPDWITGPWPYKGAGCGPIRYLPLIQFH